VDDWGADSALYSQANLQILSAHRGRWITHVPETIKLAQQPCAEVGEPTELLPGYRYRRVEVDYGGVRQRGLVITSVHALQRAASSVQRRLRKTSEQELKAFRALSRRRFACEADARQALADFQATLNVLQLTEAGVQYLEQGRHPGWSVIGLPTSDPQVRESWLWRRATFILATHELDDQRLSDQDLLRTYKQQQKAEWGFRFLKDPRF
jgi:transposase